MLATVGLAACMGLAFLLFERYNIGNFVQEIIEIKALFILVSFESIRKSETLKQQFMAKMDDFKKLK